LKGGDKMSKIKKILLGLFIFIILVIIISIAFNQSGSNQNTTTNIATISIGDTVYLFTSVDQDVLIAVTRDDLTEIIKLAHAGDTLGMTQMVLQGRAYFVKPNTKALVIDSEVAVRKVRIYEGDMIGETGWVPFEFCKK